MFLLQGLHCSCNSGLLLTGLLYLWAVLLGDNMPHPASSWAKLHTGLVGVRPSYTSLKGKGSQAVPCLDALQVPCLRLRRIGSHALIVQSGA